MTKAVLVTGGGGLTGRHMIPRCIYQTWETHDIHDDLQKIINSWKEKNPTFTYKLYDKQERERFIIDHFEPNVIETYRKIKPGPYKADLWRYCILYIKGGFYVDIDTLCCNSIENYINDTTEFISVVDLYVHPYKHNIANGFIGIKAGHPIMLSCIHAIVEDVKDNKMHHVGMDFCGPGCLGMSVNKYLGLPIHSSFRHKEGQLEKRIILLKFLPGREYITDNHNNILFQNKNGSKEIQNAYNIETQRNGSMCDWGKYYWNGQLK